MRQIFDTLLIVTASICVSQSASGQETQATLPIEQFTRYDEINSPSLSPDGNQIAYVTGKYGRSALAIISTRERKLVGGV